MKIEGTTQTSALTGAKETQASGKRIAPSTAKPARDSVTLSAASGQMQALEGAVNASSGFDTAKVEAIKQAISDGRFTINAEVIADKLITSTRELIAQHKG